MPAAFILLILSNSIMMVMQDMLKGRGSIVDGVPISSVFDVVGCGGGYRSLMYDSHFSIGYIVDDVEDGGSSIFQKLAGLYVNSLSAHFLNLFIFYYLDLDQTSNSYSRIF